MWILTGYLVDIKELLVLFRYDYAIVVDFSVKEYLLGTHVEIFTHKNLWCLKVA